MVSDWTYQEGDRGADSSNSKDDDKKYTVGTFSSETTKGTIKTTSYNESTGETETHVVEHDGPNLQYPYTHPDPQSAKGAASTKAKKAKKAGKQMTLTAPCTQDMLNLTAESRITTLGFGQSEDRRWQVESIEWSLNSSGLIARFSLATDIQAKGKSGKGKDDKLYKIGKLSETRN